MAVWGTVFVVGKTVGLTSVTMADVVIRNGTVVDGTGESEPYVGDVAFKDGAQFQPDPIAPLFVAQLSIA